MDDRKIIAAIVNRDEQALALAVRQYSKLLWKTALPILTSAAPVQEAEECVADVFIYLWQHPEKYDPDKGKLSSWLSMVARSRAVDRYRRLVRAREVPLEEIAAERLGYDERMERREEKERLASCMDELDGTEKEVIIRRYYHEQKPAEIAAALDMPKKQVENRLYYAKKKLRKLLES